MNITSPAFGFGDYIPEIFTCDGNNTNPELVFTDIPENTVSLVLHMYDPDVPLQIHPEGTWHHWLLVNLPPTTKGIKKGDDLTGVSCKNSWGELGYGGPCPPDGTAHRYFFRLVALNTMLDLREGASIGDVMNAVSNCEIDRCELMGRYLRDKTELETIVNEMREEEDA